MTYKKCQKLLFNVCMKQTVRKHEVTHLRCLRCRSHGTMPVVWRTPQLNASLVSYMMVFTVKIIRNNYQIHIKAPPQPYWNLIVLSILSPSKYIITFPRVRHLSITPPPYQIHMWPKSHTSTIPPLFQYFVHENVHHIVLMLLFAECVHYTSAFLDRSTLCIFACDSVFLHNMEWYRGVEGVETLSDTSHPLCAWSSILAG